MQANRMSCPKDEREDKQLQRAVMGELLHGFPTQLTRTQLRCRGFGFQRLDRVLFILDSVGLIFREGDVALPSLPARHFDWLEL